MNNGNNSNSNGTNHNGSNSHGAEHYFPASRRVYKLGTQTGVRVPFREITQHVTKTVNGSIEVNDAIHVYETSGPWGDPAYNGDVRDGLPALRRDWIIARGDVEEYEGRQVLPVDNGYRSVEEAAYAREKSKGKLEEFPGLRRAPLRAKAGRRVTQMHYARQGIVTPEMEFIAIRENQYRENLYA